VALAALATCGLSLPLTATASDGDAHESAATRYRNATTPVQAVRRHGGLHLPEVALPLRVISRTRSHVQGDLNADSVRWWAGPPVPDWLPLGFDDLELTLLDVGSDHVMAVYRSFYTPPPPTARPTGWPGATNSRFEARSYGLDGKLRWRVNLNRYFRTGYVELGDIRYVDGVLYFNDACLSYASLTNNTCSSLLAVNPRSGKVIWRTPPRISRARLAVSGAWIIAGYGFTSERDHLHVIRRSDGQVVHKRRLPSASEHIEVAGDVLHVRTYSHIQRYKMLGFDGKRPHLRRLGPGQRRH